MPQQLTAAQAHQASYSSKDEILPLFYRGQKVRLTKPIRNDGTFPFAARGEILMQTGSEGYVRHIGDFLQVIRVYEVDFFEHGMIYGCREEELEAAEDGYDEMAEELEWLKKHREERQKMKLQQEAK